MSNPLIIKRYQSKDVNGSIAVDVTNLQDAWCKLRTSASKKLCIEGYLEFIQELLTLHLYCEVSKTNDNLGKHFHAQSVDLLGKSPEDFFQQWWNAGSHKNLPSVMELAHKSQLHLFLHWKQDKENLEDQKREQIALDYSHRLFADLGVMGTFSLAIMTIPKGLKLADFDGLPTPTVPRGEFKPLTKMSLSQLKDTRGGTVKALVKHWTDIGTGRYLKERVAAQQRFLNEIFGHYRSHRGAVLAKCWYENSRPSAVINKNPQEYFMNWLKEEKYQEASAVVKLIDWAYFEFIAHMADKNGFASSDKEETGEAIERAEREVRIRLVMRMMEAGPLGVVMAMFKTLTPFSMNDFERRHQLSEGAEGEDLHHFFPFILSVKDSEKVVARYKESGQRAAKKKEKRKRVSEGQAETGSDAKKRKEGGEADEKKEDLLKGSGGEKGSKTSKDEKSVAAIDEKRKEASSGKEGGKADEKKEGLSGNLNGSGGEKGSKTSKDEKSVAAIDGKRKEASSGKEGGKADEKEEGIGNRTQGGDASKGSSKKPRLDQIIDSKERESVSSVEALSSLLLLSTGRSSCSSLMSHTSSLSDKNAPEAGRTSMEHIDMVTGTEACYNKRQKIWSLLSECIHISGRCNVGELENSNSVGDAALLVAGSFLGTDMMVPCGGNQSPQYITTQLSFKDLLKQCANSSKKAAQSVWMQKVADSYFYLGTQAESADYTGLPCLWEFLEDRLSHESCGERNWALRAIVESVKIVVEDGGYVNYQGDYERALDFYESLTAETSTGSESSHSHLSRFSACTAFSMEDLHGAPKPKPPVWPPSNHKATSSELSLIKEGETLMEQSADLPTILEYAKRANQLTGFLLYGACFKPRLFKEGSDEYLIVYPGSVAALWTRPGTFAFEAMRSKKLSNYTKMIDVSKDWTRRKSDRRKALGITLAVGHHWVQQSLCLEGGSLILLDLLYKMTQFWSQPFMESMFADMTHSIIHGAVPRAVAVTSDGSALIGTPNICMLCERPVASEGGFCCGPCLMLLLECQVRFLQHDKDELWRVLSLLPFYGDVMEKVPPAFVINNYCRIKTESVKVCCNCFKVLRDEAKDPGIQCDLPDCFANSVACSDCAPQGFVCRFCHENTNILETILEGRSTAVGHGLFPYYLTGVPDVSIKPFVSLKELGCCLRVDCLSPRYLVGEGSDKFVETLRKMVPSTCGGALDFVLGVLVGKGSGDSEASSSALAQACLLLTGYHYQRCTILMSFLVRVRNEIVERLCQLYETQRKEVDDDVSEISEIKDTEGDGAEEVDRGAVDLLVNEIILEVISEAEAKCPMQIVQEVEDATNQMVSRVVAEAEAKANKPVIIIRPPCSIDMERSRRVLDASDYMYGNSYSEEEVHKLTYSDPSRGLSFQEPEYVNGQFSGTMRDEVVATLALRHGIMFPLVGLEWNANNCFIQVALESIAVVLTLVDGGWESIKSTHTAFVCAGRYAPPLIRILEQVRLTLMFHPGALQKPKLMIPKLTGLWESYLRRILGCTVVGVPDDPEKVLNAMFFLLREAFDATVAYRVSGATTPDIFPSIAYYPALNVLDTLIEQAANVGMKEAANVGMEEAANVGMKEAANVGMEEAANVGMEEAANVGMKEAANVGMKEAANVDTVLSVEDTIVQLKDKLKKQETPSVLVTGINFVGTSTRCRCPLELELHSRKYRLVSVLRASLYKEAEHWTILHLLRVETEEVVFLEIEGLNSVVFESRFKLIDTSAFEAEGLFMFIWKPIPRPMSPKEKTNVDNFVGTYSPLWDKPVSKEKRHFSYSFGEISSETSHHQYLTFPRQLIHGFKGRFPANVEKIRDLIHTKFTQKGVTNFPETGQVCFQGAHGYGQLIQYRGSGRGGKTIYLSRAWCDYLHHKQKNGIFGSVQIAKNELSYITTPGPLCHARHSHHPTAEDGFLRWHVGEGEVDIVEHMLEEIKTLLPPKQRFFGEDESFAHAQGAEPENIDNNFFTVRNLDVLKICDRTIFTGDDVAAAIIQSFRLFLRHCPPQLKGANAIVIGGGSVFTSMWNEPIGGVSVRVPPGESRERMVFKARRSLLLRALYQAALETKLMIPKEEFSWVLESKIVEESQVSSFVQEIKKFPMEIIYGPCSLHYVHWRFHSYRGESRFVEIDGLRPMSKKESTYRRKIDVFLQCLDATDALVFTERDDLTPVQDKGADCFYFALGSLMQCLRMPTFGPRWCITREDIDPIRLYVFRMFAAMRGAMKRGKTFDDRDLWRELVPPQYIGGLTVPRPKLEEWKYNGPSEVEE